MLIAAITAYLLIHFGSHSLAVAPQLEQATQLIKKDVADEARQKQALAIVDQMKAATKAYAQRREKSIGSLNGVLGKRATPSSEIVSAAQPLIIDDSATAEKLLDLRFQLKSVLTQSEWAKVFPAPTGSRPAAKKSA
jgi:hypothetical protein